MDILSVDKYGHIMKYAESSHNSYELLKLFQPFLQSKKAYPIHSFTKTIITGNSGAGKSSLPNALYNKPLVDGYNGLENLL